LKSLRSILWLAILLTVSCGSDSNDAATPASRRTLSQRLDEKNSYKVDANGNWTPTNDRRSSFEAQAASQYSKGKFQKKDYKAGEYAKKSWWGNKDYGKKTYAGNTDGSRFQKSSRFDGKGAREQGDSAGLSKTYQTDAYATNAAREAGVKGVDRTSDAETDQRRKVYKAPAIIDWKEQRSMDLEQSKGILGR
jgi:hypothetical protein